MTEFRLKSDRAYDQKRSFSVMNCNDSQYSRRGFTLIELLVVIAIKQ
jgi:type II secretory pathway pseudopilin PulG